MTQVYVVRDRDAGGKIYGIFKKPELAKNLKAYLMKEDKITAGIDKVATDLAD